MAFWKNTHTNQRVYPESDQFFQSQSKKKTVLAWVAAFGSLLVIASLFVGLFFGGRWFYRQATKPDGQQIVGTNNASSSEEVNTSGNNKNLAQDNSAVNSEESTTPADQSSDESTDTRISSASTDEPGIADNDSTMPNTGPKLNTLVLLFVITTVLTSIYHANRQRSDGK